MHGHFQMIGQNRAIQRGAQVNMARWKVKDNPHRKSQETEPLTRLLSRNLILEGNEPARNKSQAPQWDWVWICGVPMAEWEAPASGDYGRNFRGRRPLMCCIQIGTSPRFLVYFSASLVAANKVWW